MRIGTLVTRPAHPGRVSRARPMCLDLMPRYGAIIRRARIRGRSSLFPRAPGLPMFRSRRSHSHYSPTRRNLSPTAPSSWGPLVEVPAGYHHRAAGVARDLLGDAPHQKALHPAEPAAEALVAHYDQPGNDLLADAQGFLGGLADAQVGLRDVAAGLLYLLHLVVQQGLVF